MQIIRNLNQIKTNLPELSLTIGNFDGMHLGHQKIVNKVKTQANSNNLASAILSFEPHPITFLRPDKSRDFRIFNLSQKLKLFRDSKIDYAIILGFNHQMANITADDFVKEILVKKLQVKDLTIGYDFIFGKNRQGNYNLLEKHSKEFNFKLNKISAVSDNDQIYSSSNIRRLIAAGKIKEANKFLSNDFAISGPVISGQKLANKLGFATANQMAKTNIIKPKFGVYKSQTYIPHLQKSFNSITNFGIKPTINGQNQQPIFETNIFDFEQNIYGKKIIVTLLDFIRDEKKFSSIDDLKQQIKLDKLKISK